MGRFCSCKLKLFFLLGFLALILKVHAQSPLDQLEAHWNGHTSKDSIHTPALFELAIQELVSSSRDSAALAQGYQILQNVLFERSNAKLPQGALQFGDTLLSIVPEEVYSMLYVNVNIAMANHYIQVGSHHKALPYIDNLKPHSLNHPNTVAPRYYELISNFHLENDQLFKAIQANKEAMDLYDSLGLQTERCRTINTLGLVYLNASNNEEALRYFRSNLKCIQASQADSIHSIGALINLGIVFFRQNRFDSALHYYQQALHAHHTYDGSMLKLAVIQANLGNVKTKLKRYDEAFFHYDTSLTIAKQLNTTYGIALNTTNLANLYNHQGKYQLAMEALDRISADVNNSNDNSMKMIYLERLAETRYGLKQYKEAYKAFKAFHIKKDSAEVSSEKVKSLTWQAQFKQQEAELRLRKMEQEQIQSELEKRTILLYSGLIIVLILGAGGGYLYYNKKKTYRAELALKENQLLKIENEKKKKELTTTALKLTQLNESKQIVAKKLSEVAEGLDGEYKSQVNQIAQKMQRQDDLSRWKEFELTFNDVHSEFYQRIKSQFPVLTPHELKICGLLRLNLTTKEIADITARAPRTVNNTRSTIRNKFGLDSGENLIDFLMRF